MNLFIIIYILLIIALLIMLFYCIGCMIFPCKTKYINEKEYQRGREDQKKAFINFLKSMECNGITEYGIGYNDCINELIEMLESNTTDDSDKINKIIEVLHTDKDDSQVVEEIMKILSKEI